MDPSAGLEGLLCGLSVLAMTVLFVLWIGGFILRVAIGWTNKVVGGHGPVRLRP
ncbi:hypothetical protein FTUN_4403 [Frigoriglobus tundricola]|uniref:Uncharacterized protein n=1 Tax=Frigoriglobus tundricola TaxID=2774151 RepID=A0A6M5YU49_9BACT|nr:hypothetical protein FTUN_4403 [Frigoriglobus tundricola]